MVLALWALTTSAMLWRAQRAVYALVCESIKYRDVIGNVCLRCGLFSKVWVCPCGQRAFNAHRRVPWQVKRHSRPVMRLMVYDMLIGSGIQVRTFKIMPAVVL